MSIIFQAGPRTALRPTQWHYSNFTSVYRSFLGPGWAHNAAFVSRNLNIITLFTYLYPLKRIGVCLTEQSRPVCPRYPCHLGNKCSLSCDKDVVHSVINRFDGNFDLQVPKILKWRLVHEVGQKLLNSNENISLVTHNKILSNSKD